MSQSTSEKKAIVGRISKIVVALRESDRLFQEKLNADEMVKDLLAIVTDNFTPEEFNNLSDAELTRRFRKVMITDTIYL